MKIENLRISLTVKEAERIIDYLDSLRAMAGGLDYEFTQHCESAGNLADRLREMKYQISRLKEL